MVRIKASPRKKFVIVESALFCSTRVNFVGPRIFLFEVEKSPHSNPPNGFQIMEIIVINSSGSPNFACGCAFRCRFLIIQISSSRNFDGYKISSSLSIGYQIYSTLFKYHKNSLCVRHAYHHLLLS